MCGSGNQPLQSAAPSSEAILPTLLTPELLGLAEEKCGLGTDTSNALAKLWVSTEITGKSINFLVDTGAAYSVLPAHVGCAYPSQISVMGTD